MITNPKTPNDEPEEGQPVEAPVEDVGTPHDDGSLFDDGVGYDDE